MDDAGFTSRPTVHKSRTAQHYTDFTGYVRIIGYILGLCWDNGKESGSYYLIPTVSHKNHHSKVGYPSGKNSSPSPKPKLCAEHWKLHTHTP